jgi:hypothetical protein
MAKMVLSNLTLLKICKNSFKFQNIKLYLFILKFIFSFTERSHLEKGMHTFSKANFYSKVILHLKEQRDSKYVLFLVTEFTQLI